MNDIENEVFTPIATALRAQFPGVFVVGEMLSNTPTKFPCVALAEVDNYSPRSMVDSSGEEIYSDVAWQLTVYSNKVAGKKSECKEIFRLADSMMFGFGFTRESVTPQVPLNNNSIYWQAARYTARVKNKTIYRN